MPVIPIYWYVHFYLARPEVTGMNFSVMEHRSYKTSRCAAVKAWLGVLQHALQQITQRVARNQKNVRLVIEAAKVERGVGVRHGG